jgi:hypothetical protein
VSPHRLWRDAAAEHRRWIILNAVVIAAVINAILNALIAWGSAAGEDQIPLWAVPVVEGPSTITDTVGTLFLLPLITTLVITSVVWHELGEGRLETLPPRRAGLLARLPPKRLRRGVYFGGICTLVLGPPAVLVLLLLDFGDISVGDFVLYKAIFGVVFGAIVTPPIALAALTDASRRHRTGDEVAEESIEDEVARPGIEPGTP